MTRIFWIATTGGRCSHAAAMKRQNASLIGAVIAAVILSFTVTFAQQNGPPVQTDIPRVSGAPAVAGWPGWIRADMDDGRVFRKSSGRSATTWTELSPTLREMELEVFSDAAQSVETAGSSAVKFGSWSFDNSAASTNRLQVTMPEDWDGDTNALRILMKIAPDVGADINLVGDLIFAYGGALTDTAGALPAAITSVTITNTLSRTNAGYVHDIVFTPSLGCTTNGPGASAVLFLQIARAADDVTNNLFLITRPVLQYAVTGGPSEW